VSQYQKGKTNLDFTEARDSGWHCIICTSLQTDNHSSTPPLLCFFTGRMPFLPPNQQRQSTEGNHRHRTDKYLDTLLADKTAQKASPAIIPKVAIGRWQTA